MLPLRAIRGTTRFGLLVLTVVALLAGLGTAWLFRHVSPRARRLVAAGLLVALALDYLAPTPRYDWIATYARPVDAVFRTMPDEVAIVEWPLNSPGVDVDAIRDALADKIVFDGRNLYEPKLMKTLGIQYHGIGRT